VEGHHYFQVSYQEFSQFLHDYHTRYSKYAFKAYDREGQGLITTDDFCHLLLRVKGHLLTNKVKLQMNEFVRANQGTEVTYAFATAFHTLLADIETTKKPVVAPRQKKFLKRSFCGMA